MAVLRLSGAARLVTACDAGIPFNCASSSSGCYTSNPAPCTCETADGQRLRATITYVKEPGFGLAYPSRHDNAGSKPVDWS